MQPENVQDRGGFVELRHFDRLFVKNAQKTWSRRGKVWSFFILDTVKTTFRMKNLTQRWKQSGPSFPKLEHFSNLQKRAWEISPPLPPSCTPTMFE